MTIYIEESLQGVVVKNDSQFSAESVWVMIDLEGSDKLLVVCVYKSPSSDEENPSALDQLMRTVGNMDHDYSHILIIGDFDFPDIYCEIWISKDDRSANFKENIRDTYFYQLVQKSTRMRVNQQSVSHRLDFRK